MKHDAPISFDPVKLCFGWLARSLPRGRGRLLAALAPFYQQGRAYNTSVGGLSIELFPSTLIERAMWYGVYETRLLRLFRRYLRAGDLCLDCGANIGWVAAHLLADVGPTGAVHCFEPLPDHISRLNALAVAAQGTLRGEGGNEHSGIHVHPYALGDCEGAMTLHISGDNHGFNTIVPELTRSELTPRSREVSVKRLDDVLADKSIERVRFAKIDVEGAEILLLRGARGVLERHGIDYLYVEMSPPALERTGERPDAAAALLREFGYQGYRVKGSRLADLKAEDFKAWNVDTFWASPRA